MVRPQQAVNVVLETIADSDDVPDDVSYLTQQADMSGGDSGVKLPVIEADITSYDELNAFNTDQSGYVRDNIGNKIGRVYRNEYEIEVDIDVYVANGSSHNVDEIAQGVRSALYPHEAAGPDDPFLDESGEPIEAIWWFTVGTGLRNDDTLQTPALRRWVQTITIRGYHEFETDESGSVSEVEITGL